MLIIEFMLWNIVIIDNLSNYKVDNVKIVKTKACFIYFCFFKYSTALLNIKPDI